MLLIKNIRIAVPHDSFQLKKKIERRLHHPIDSYTIYKRSLDARKEPVYVYSILVDIANEKRYLGEDIVLYDEKDLDPPKLSTDKKIIIAGYGPSGIFSALRLVDAGFKVAVFEKGKRISAREKDVELFFKTGILDETSNVQFGEGGAGTFSDAKLTTRIKDPYIPYILNTFIRHGADPAIRYENHAHVGTDRIRKVIASLTDELIAKGCEFHFEEPMLSLLLDDDHAVKGILTAKGSYQADHVLLGIGHSAYETIQTLKKQGVHVEKKDIAIGFRVEHPQKMIDERQTDSLIESANEYFLRFKGEKGVYSFCMCPGGLVIPAMSEKETIVTNGMSYAARDSGIANSAILIQKPNEEFDDGYVFLHDIEKRAYAYSGSYKALAQNIADFMNGSLNDLIFSSTYPLGTVLFDFNQLFNETDRSILKEAISYFDRKIPGFIEKGIMVGPETRSSSPVRITRNGSYESINTNGLYSMGEGAGYGGGIMSCCLDGIRIANALIEKYEKI